MRGREDGRWARVAKAASSVEKYLTAVPLDRQPALRAIRQVVLDNLPPGYDECVSVAMMADASTQMTRDRR